jgi:hypothetical protein
MCKKIYVISNPDKTKSLLLKEALYFYDENKLSNLTKQYAPKAPSKATKIVFAYKENIPIKENI